MIYAHQLRGLIRNDEALVEHYVQWIANLEPGELAPVPLTERISQAVQRRKARRGAIRACYRVPVEAYRSLVAKQFLGQ